MKPKKHKLVTHFVKCQYPGCGHVMRVKVDESRIQSDGTVKGFREYCFRCQPRVDSHSHGVRRSSGRDKLELDRIHRENVSCRTLGPAEIAEVKSLYLPPVRQKETPVYSYWTNAAAPL
jgi:hypothetical protein